MNNQRARGNIQNSAASDVADDTDGGQTPVDAVTTAVAMTAAAFKNPYVVSLLCRGLVLISV